MFGSMSHEVVLPDPDLLDYDWAWSSGGGGAPLTSAKDLQLVGAKCPPGIAILFSTYCKLLDAEMQKLATKSLNRKNGMSCMDHQQLALAPPATCFLCFSHDVYFSFAAAQQEKRLAACASSLARESPVTPRLVGIRKTARSWSLAVAPARG